MTLAVCRGALFAILIAALGTNFTLADDDSKASTIVVKSTFENGEQIDPVAGLILGVSPARALLKGGAIEIRGVRSAYNTPPHAWVFD